MLPVWASATEYRTMTGTTAGISTCVRTVAGGDNDSDGSGELKAEATSVGDLDSLHAQHAHDLVAISGESDHDTNTSQDQDPLGHLRQKTPHKMSMAEQHHVNTVVGIDADVSESTIEAL